MLLALKMASLKMEEWRHEPRTTSGLSELEKSRKWILP